MGISGLASPHFRTSGHVTVYFRSRYGHFRSRVTVAAPRPKFWPCDSAWSGDFNISASWTVTSTCSTTTATEPRSSATEQGVDVQREKLATVVGRTKSTAIDGRPWRNFFSKPRVWDKTVVRGSNSC